jgi:LysR substrate binding domain
VDTYFPRAHLIECLRRLQAEFPTVAINLRITTMQGGERLVLEATCALAVTITDVPELSRGTIERQHLCDAQMVTVCAPSHPLAAICDHGKDARCDKARRIGDDRCLKTQRFAVAREPLCTFTCSKRRHKCQEATLDSDTVNRDYTLWIDPEPKSTARRVFPTGRNQDIDFGCIRGLDVESRHRQLLQPGIVLSHTDRQSRRVRTHGRTRSRVRRCGRLRLIITVKASTTLASEMTCIEKRPMMDSAL